MTLNNTQVHSVLRILDANLNRLIEGLRVIEDICRYMYDDEENVKRLKTIRHKARLNHINEILQSRDIKNDRGKISIDSETKRDNIQAILHANFHRVCESARVLEECLKLDETKKYATSELFKAIRYEIYEIHVNVIARNQ